MGTNIWKFAVMAVAVMAAAVAYMEYLHPVVAETASPKFEAPETTRETPVAQPEAQRSVIEEVPIEHATISPNMLMGYDVEIEAKEARLRALEWQIGRQEKIAKALAPDGQIGLWMAACNPADLPSKDTIILMAELMLDYPIELQTYDGEWLADRVTAGDWDQHGPTIDEAIILHFGPMRIALACTPEQRAFLRSEWEEEGYFR